MFTRVCHQNIKRNLAILCVSFVAVMFSITKVYALGDVCCKYYKGTGPSDQCSVFDKNTGVVQILGAGKTFPCSAYDKNTNTVTYKNSTDSLGPDDLVTYANYAGSMSPNVDLAKISSPDACPYQASGYKLMIQNLYPVKLNVDKGGASGEAALKTLNECSLGLLLRKQNADLDQKLIKASEQDLEDVLKIYNEQKAAVEEAYKFLQDAEKKFCCVPKQQKDPNESMYAQTCEHPVIKPEIEQLYNSFVGKQSVIPQQLSPFATYSPDSTSNIDTFAMYLSCGDNLPAGGTQYNLRLYQYICLCKKDYSDCEQGGYLLEKDCKEKATAKPDASSWQCISVNDSCKSFIEKKIEKEDYDPFPFELAAIQAMGLKLKKTSANSTQELLGIMMKAFMGVLGSIALAMFVYGGFLIMASGGNEEKSGKGTQILVWSALGVIMILSAYMLVKFVLEIIG